MRYIVVSVALISVGLIVASEVEEPVRPAVNWQVPYTEPAGVTGSVSDAGVPALPAAEVSIGSLLPPAPSHDYRAAVHADSSGSVLVLSLDNFVLRQRRSTDSGSSFGSEEAVPGLSGAAPIVNFASKSSSDGSVYVLLWAGDSVGGINCQIVSTPDLGVTWVAPTVAIADSVAPGWFPYSTKFDARDGILAVAATTRGGAVLATVSNDSGASWREAVHLNTGQTPGRYGTSALDVAIGADGAVHVAYDESRSDWESYRIWYSKSLDGGLTFAPGRELTETCASGHSCRNPSVGIARNGNVLVTHSDETSKRVVVGASIDGGDTFVRTLDDAIDDIWDSWGRVDFVVSPASDTMLLVLTASHHAIWRSPDSGAEWGARSVVTDAGSWASSGFDEDKRPAAVRTSMGDWGFAWEESGAIKASTSRDDGVNWDAPHRVDQPGASENSATILSSGLAASGANRVNVVFTDGRKSPGGNRDVYHNVSEIGALDFSNSEIRVDSDPTLSNPEAILLSGASGCVTNEGDYYVTFVAVDEADSPQVYVARSEDGGRTFHAPSRASAPVTGRSLTGTPLVAADDTGNVVVVYTAVTDSSRVLRYAHSADFGSNWGAETALGAPGGGSNERQIVRVAEGEFLVSWGHTPEVFVARSTNGGRDFDTTAVGWVEQAISGSVMCVADDSVVVAFIENWPATIHSVMSSDGGETWGPQTTVTTSAGNPGSNSNFDVGCLPSGEAVIAWAPSIDNGDGTWTYPVRTNRFDGNAWGEDLIVESAVNADAQDLDLVFATSSTALLAYRRYTRPSSAVLMASSSDGGVTFGEPYAIDVHPETEPYTATSPRLAADGSGRAWVVWNEYLQAVFTSVLGRFSDDAGESWTAPLRLDDASPQGSRWHSGIAKEGAISVHGGVAHVTWTGWRSSQRSDVLATSWNPGDLDHDGSASALDCADDDPLTYPGAPQSCDGINNDCLHPAWPLLDDTNESDDDGDLWSECAGDCDDAVSTIFPGAGEECNGVDDDCNDLIDDHAGVVDTDADGVNEVCDNCRQAYNPTQLDTDADGLGNSCDNCVNVVNPAQADEDSDARGDACDNCPHDSNQLQDDYDVDGVGDACDNCFSDPNPTQSDFDLDSQGDHCDLDDGLIYVFTTDPDYMEWQVESGFDSWNAYRGDLAELAATGTYTQAPGSNHMARQDCGLMNPWMDDFWSPAAGGSAFYLVTGNAGLEESSLGTDSAGQERPNYSACP